MEKQTINLEQYACGLATEKFISVDNNIEGTAYQKYQFLKDCVSKNEDPEDWMAWQPLDNLEWSDILANIEQEAAAILNTFKFVLENVKAGIIAGAIDCSLVHDYNELDMSHMFEVGQVPFEQ